MTNEQPSIQTQADLNQASNNADQNNVKAPNKVEEPLSFYRIGLFSALSDDAAVARQRILEQLKEATFHKPTKEDVYEINSRVIRWKSYELELVVEENPNALENYPRMTNKKWDAFIVFYQIDKLTTFTSASSEWIPVLKRHLPLVPIFIAMSGIDKRVSAPQNFSNAFLFKSLTERGTEEAKARGLRFIEVSLIEPESVKHMFEEVLTDCVLREEAALSRPSTPQPAKSKSWLDATAWTRSQSAKK